MSQEVDLDLATKLEFRLNHEKKLVESDDPSIYLRSRGGTSAPHLRFFTLHWSAREIPASVHMQSRDLGRNDKGQRVSETHWTVQQIGFPDFGAHGGPGRAYRFASKEEYICAATLMLKALTIYGGRFNLPELNSFPEHRRISARLSNELRIHMYGHLN
jgi:hypothetical protein